MDKALIKLLLFVALFCAPSHAQILAQIMQRAPVAAPALIGLVPGHWCMAADPVFSCTMPGNVTAGNTLVFFSFNNNFAAGAVPVHDDTRCGTSGLWTFFQSGGEPPTSFLAIETMGCVAPTSGPDTISITPTTGAMFLVMEIGNVAATSPFDTSSAVTNVYVQTTVSNTITTAVAGEFVIACNAYEYGTTTITANNGFTWLAGSGTVAASRPYNCFGKTAGGAGAYPITLTNDNPGNERGFAVTMLAIKPR